MLLAKVAGHSVGVPKAVDQVRAAKVVRGRTAIKARKSIMDSLLLCQPALKIREMALNGAHQKGASPLTRGLESLEIQAKASDFDGFSSKSAIILVLLQFAAVLSSYRLMLRST